MDIRWKTVDGVAALMASGEAEVRIAAPAATGVLMKNENVREALDLRGVDAPERQPPHHDYHCSPDRVQ